MSKKLNIIYCGTPDFSVPTLEMLAAHPDVQLKAVVSMPDRPAGRGQNLTKPPVIEFALSKKIKIIQTENINKDKTLIDFLDSEKIDLVIVLAFAQFLNSKILSSPKLGCFNIHTSLLPRYRGAAPIQYAILNGDHETGVSIQKMVKKMDAGDIVKLNKVVISPKETGEQLYTRLKFQAALTCNEFINDIITNKISYSKQDESQVTFAPTLKKEDAFIDFKNLSATQIERKVRAFHPWPGTYCMLNDKRLKIIEVEVPVSGPTLGPGIHKIEANQFIVGTKKGNLQLKLVQFEGKKVCTDQEFINGIANNFVDFVINP